MLTLKEKMAIESYLNDECEELDLTEYVDDIFAPKKAAIRRLNEWNKKLQRAAIAGTTDKKDIGKMSSHATYNHYDNPYGKDFSSKPTPKKVVRMSDYINEYEEETKYSKIDEALTKKYFAVKEAEERYEKAVAEEKAAWKNLMDALK